ncbi:MAG: 50S ribosomal protein L17 [Lachnospiraceae bacterium]|nr:50S ribosomal protein L17 [Lachnospiraceae bacterium]
MASYKKLGRTSEQRKAILRNQVTNLLYHGKIRTTETKAKEIRKIAEGIIAMAIREKANYKIVTVTAKVPRKDADGKRVKEAKEGKKISLYHKVQKEIKKDNASRLHARRQMMKVFYPVTEMPVSNKGRKKNIKQIDMVAKMFDEVASKYDGRNGGYSRIVKIGPRKGDSAMEVLLELV